MILPERALPPYPVPAASGRGNFRNIAPARFNQDAAWKHSSFSKSRRHGENQRTVRLAFSFFSQIQHELHGFLAKLKIAGAQHSGQQFARFAFKGQLCLQKAEERPREGALPFGKKGEEPAPAVPRIFRPAVTKILLQYSEGFPQTGAGSPIATAKCDSITWSAFSWTGPACFSAISSPGRHRRSLCHCVLVPDLTNRFLQDVCGAGQLFPSLPESVERAEFHECRLSDDCRQAEAHIGDAVDVLYKGRDCENALFVPEDRFQDAGYRQGDRVECRALALDDFLAGHHHAPGDAFAILRVADRASSAE